MTRLLASRFLTIPRLLLATLLLATTAAVAFAQFGGANEKLAGAAARPKMEYLHQEVLTAGIVETLNDLDGQGWEVFQVVPVWSIRNQGDNNLLEPKSYQVFGRRAVKGK